MADQAQEKTSEQSSASGKPDEGKRQEPPTQEKRREGHYTPEEWRDRARTGSLRVSPHVVAGALHGQDAEDVFSEDELQKLVADFAEREG